MNTYLATSIQDTFYIVSIVFMIVLLLFTVAVSIAIVIIKRKLTRKIQSIKNIPLKSKIFTLTFIKSLFGK